MKRLVFGSKYCAGNRILPADSDILAKIRGIDGRKKSVWGIKESVLKILPIDSRFYQITQKSQEREKLTRYQVSGFLALARPED